MSKKNVLILTLLSILVLSFIIFRTGIFTSPKDLKFADIIVTPDKNHVVKYGQNFEMQLNENNLKGYDSIIVVMNKNIRLPLETSFKVVINTKNIGLGPHFVDVTLWKKEKSNTVALPFNIVSDLNVAQSMYSIVRKLAHDDKAYTQGLEYHNGFLYESGGQYGESLIRKVQPSNGVVVKTVEVPKEFFAEGLTILNDKVYQLTWKEGIMLIYDEELNILSKSGFRSATGEGWGMCNDGTNLIISDGSNKLTWIDPETLQPLKTIHVYAGQKEVNYLNELEFVDGFIYANIYTTHQIAKIEASTGRVTNVYEFESLKMENTEGEVFNGIAFLPKSGTFMVTGKNWKNMYEVRM